MVTAEGKLLALKDTVHKPETLKKVEIKE